MPLRPWRTVFAGWLIVTAITPLSQFLTIMAVNASIETATPVGWALGLLISIVLAGLVVRALARRRGFGRANLALLYSMLALAVPLMNIGLIRQYFLASHAVLREYLYEGTSTYRTAYNALNDRWFPVVPTRDGLAWNRANRVLRLLEQPQVRDRQAAARRLFEDAERLAPGAPAAAKPLLPALRAAVQDLALDAATAVLARTDPDLLADWEVLDPLRAHAAAAAQRSAAAREMLGAAITADDEWALSLLPSNLNLFGYSGRERLLSETESLPEQAQLRLRARLAELQPLEESLRAAAMALGENDRGRLLAQWRDAERQRLSALPRADFNAVRASFVFRISRDERRAIIAQDGLTGPNQNLNAFFLGLWHTPQQQAAMAALPWHERVLTVARAVPWSVYRVPLLSWGLLFGCLFFFLMCLAEWLRRKWVSRENLPFPLVEAADYVIRHDYRLETAGDLAAPEPRNGRCNRLFLIGCALGFLLLFFQGLGHYGFVNNPGLLRFDFSKNIFEVAGGGLKNFPATIFVISPVVVGIVFLLSLEVGFSIWFSYLLYALAVWVVRSADPGLTDSNWTGFGGGKLFPFPMEQMLGACLCFALYHWWKVLGQRERGRLGPSDPYLPPALTRWGLVSLPLLIGLMFWDLGLTSVPMMLLFSLAVLAITIAMARVRAETGLPGQQAIYEFTKFPIILGMTGAMGAKAYAAFMNLVFLPTTMLFRTLPQQLENMELARRHRIPFRTLALGSLTTVLLTLPVAAVSFLLFSYFMGGDFYGFLTLPPQTTPSAVGIATTPLWVGHFLGEPGLDRFTDVNWYRITAIAVGFAVVGILLLVRQRYMRFPLHPVGYLVLLLSIYYSWADPYVRVPAEEPLDSSVIWGSALVAWLIKRLVVKFGGMNVYKQAKPLFVGLIVGSVAAVFLWNMADLAFSLYATRDIVPGDFLRRFLETTPFTPAYY